MSREFTSEKGERSDPKLLISKSLTLSLIRYGV